MNDRLWNCGAASFCDLETHTRTVPTQAFSLVTAEGSLVGCFSGTCVTFTESFATVPCSCTASIDATAAFGRIADRSLICAISQGP
jgi:hypothetical protein